jgi:hypothetical protein
LINAIRTGIFLGDLRRAMRSALNNKIFCVLGWKRGFEDWNFNREKKMRLDYSGVSLSRVNSGKDLDALASMRVMLIMRERKKQLALGPSPERLLNDKLHAYKFVDLLGVRRPRVISARGRHDELPSDLTNFVIKPVNGKTSRGVYAVFNENLIKQVKTAEVFSGRQALIDHLRSDLQSGVVKEDRWIIEELIVEDDHPLVAARDLKFYCFYGRVSHVMEITRDPVTRYCFWDVNSKLKEVGGFAEKLFIGGGFKPNLLRLAERMSSEIPAPFMRIDFHATGSDMVFCEFTPTSGPIWDYEKGTDQLLGDYYLEAEARLLADLLNGKRFDAYNFFRKNALGLKSSAIVEKPLAVLA